MKMVISPRLIFYVGFLIFLPGHVSFLFNLDFLEFLKVDRNVDLFFCFISMAARRGHVAEIHEIQNEDELSFFWNKIAIRLWSGIIFIIMFFVTWIYLLEVIGE